MNRELLNLLNGIELERELNAFARDILAKEGIEANADDIAKFLIECITVKANDGKLKMVGISDETMARLIVRAVDYLDEWKREKTQAEVKAQKTAAQAEKKQDKAIEKAKATPKPAPKPVLDIDLPDTRTTANKFVQLEIDFDNYK